MNQALNDRLRTRFQTLGGDNDGYLTAEDFDQEVNRILQATKVSKNTPRAQLLRSAYQTYWWALLDGLDRNKDGKISFEDTLRSFTACSGSSPSLGHAPMPWIGSPTWTPTDGSPVRTTWR